ncbi:membrane protein [Tenuifilaceae bacterium CYCD]|nr:membrane protein [Tenuifilaceae bacterium CYCD]
MKKYNLLIAALFSLLLVSCGDDYLETAPTSSVTEEDMLSSLTGAETVMDGINRATYTYYDAHDRFGQKSIDYALDCLGDDFYPTERGYGWFVSWYQWLEHRNTNSSNLEYVWAYYYDIINNANLVITNLEKMTFEATADINKQSNLLAQAYTYRAYSLYYLVQLFSEGTKGVPVPTTPNSGALARSTVDQVYTQINNDLSHAADLFINGGADIDRVNCSQINYYVTRAIQARVALTRQDWPNAITYAEEVIAEFPLCSDYTYGWNKANDEWVWGAVLIDEQQTSYASFFSHMDPFFGGYCTLGNHHIMSQTVFDYLPSNDARKIVNQPDVYYSRYFSAYFGSKARSSFKYTGMGDWTNDYLYIKSGEMYLIAAEAYARSTQDGSAQNMLNELNSNRTLFGTYTPVATTGDALIADILMYRRAELWGDGQRFFDMKRLGVSNIGRTGQPMCEQTYTYPAGDVRFTFLIPQQEMDSNPLMEQNTL